MKKLAAVALVAVGVVSAWQLRGGDDAPPDSSNPVLDRIWVDKLPTTERETFNIFVVLEDDEFGVFDSRSMWKGHFEFFKVKDVKQGHVRIHYPQTGETETLHGKVRRCSERDFDYCLELTGGSRGVTRYFSKEEWVIDGVHGQAALATRVDQLVR
jgi:hypothetical protein